MQKKLILVGGGHTHVLFLKHWARKPIPDLELTLISPQEKTPYSGMLPGLIAGHYQSEEIFINLPKLCAKANVKFICSSVSNIETNTKTIEIENTPNIGYDILSLDIGAAPDQSIPGVIEYATSVKPISLFYEQWLKVKQNLQNTQFQALNQNNKYKLVVAGAGAGGLEIMLAMNWVLENDPATCGKTDYTLCFKTPKLLPGYPNRIVNEITQLCEQRNISLKPNFKVKQVSKPALIAENSATSAPHELPYDRLFWCTQARAAVWPSNSGLASNSEGFIRVNQYLQSISHQDIFAVGDIAHMEFSPRPKAGVYAVRQAPYLYKNIYNYALKRKLKVYKPQDNFLSLLALGNKTALGFRKPLPIFSGAWVWHWKRRLDEMFMSEFR